jgi:hypothetical protein
VKATDAFEAKFMPWKYMENSELKKFAPLTRLLTPRDLSALRGDSQDTSRWTSNQEVTLINSIVDIA